MPLIPVPGARPPITQYNGGTAKEGDSNIYPPHECTWWADERYHQLTGFYVPWAADAHGWLAGAMQNGWETSSLPPDVPSIIVLQPGVQLADIHYGHVGVVEKVNRDGSVTTSDLNWGPDAATKAVVTSVVFHTGPGVNFVWVGGATNTGQSKPITSTFVSNATGKVGAVLSPGASVAQTLVALDMALVVTNPFDVQADPSRDIQILGQDTGIMNPLDWSIAVTANMINNLVAITMRTIFIWIGIAILLKVSSAFIDYGAIAETAKSGASRIAGLAALA